jgi:molybdenum cofactor synthesis domain-containing protein
MSKKIYASILGIGTELTSGQILNRNATWISKKMAALGAETLIHLVVPDEKNLILESLETCAKYSDLIFVTGGLGPTSDDFTRDVIAEWTGLEMLWDESSWQHLSERLRQRGIPVREMQKQQCYFPKGAQILTNKMGTANGFHIQHQNKNIFILPGPPNEIEAIWQDWIKDILEKKCQDIEKTITRSWDTIGLGESQIAELVEPALAGCSFERGYRVHLPYVEFKLSYTSSQESQAQKWLSAVDQALQSVTLLKNGEDMAELLVEKLKLYPRIYIIDESEGSHLIKRLFPVMKNLFQRNQISLSNGKSEHKSDGDLVLSLLKKDATSAVAELSFAGIDSSHLISSPYLGARQDRAPAYFAEKAMLFFFDSLKNSRHVVGKP